MRAYKVNFRGFPAIGYFDFVDISEIEPAAEESERVRAVDKNRSAAGNCAADGNHFSGDGDPVEGYAKREKEDEGEGP